MRHCEEFREPTAIVCVEVGALLVVGGVITLGGALGVSVTFAMSVRYPVMAGKSPAIDKDSLRCPTKLKTRSRTHVLDELDSWSSRSCK